MTTMMADVKLSDDQASAVRKIKEWAQTDNPRFVLGGLAGTGKTLVSSFIANVVLRERIAAIVAPTGKAASRLRQKGIERATTLHSLLYTYGGSYEKDNGEMELVFHDKDGVECAGIVICDEASMVGTREIETLSRVAHKVLWVGDHGQLPSVRGDLGLMLLCDAQLTQIHRQGEGSGIIEFAHALRGGESPVLLAGYSEYCDVDVRGGATSPMPHLFELLELAPDAQVIVGYNKLRTRINETMRGLRFKRIDSTFSALGANWVLPGDRLVCLRTDYRVGLYNGECLLVSSVEAVNQSDRTATISYYVEGHDRRGTVEIERDDNLNEERERNAPLLVDYAYALTCHKSQGSEWDDVIVIDPGSASPFDLKRWRYTAATRAARRLFYVA